MNLCKRRLVPTVAAGMALCAAWGAAAADRPPAGLYEVVAVRMVTGVARPLAPDAEAVAGSVLGRQIRLGAPGRWIDGRRCRGDIRPTGRPWPNLADPLLSDVELAASRDRRVNRVYTLNCDGQGGGGAVPILQVDDRVLVATMQNGSAYAILEAPLDRESARKVEAGLTDAGLDPGSLDGVLDATARRALAYYAHRHGAVYAFDRGVVTEVMLGLIGVKPKPAR